VNWIDTAAVYGLGHSEEVVARALQEWQGPRPYVFTKCGGAVAVVQARECGCDCVFADGFRTATGAMTRERLAGLAKTDWRTRNEQFKEPKLSENLKLVERLRAVGARHGRSPGETAIAWTLRHPAVTGAIVGARNSKQLACQREAVIRPLAETDRLSCLQVNRAAKILGLGRSVSYRLIARFRQRPQTSSLLLAKAGRPRSLRTGIVNEHSMDIDCWPVLGRGAHGVGSERVGCFVGSRS